MKKFREGIQLNNKARILEREHIKTLIWLIIKVTLIITISISSLNKFITITCLLNMSHFKSGKRCPKPETNTCHMHLLPHIKLVQTLITIRERVLITTQTEMVWLLTRMTEFLITWVSMEFRGQVVSKTSGIKTHMVTQVGRAIQDNLMSLKVTNWSPNKYLKRSVAWRKNPRCP